MPMAVPSLKTGFSSQAIEDQNKTLNSRPVHSPKHRQVIHGQPPAKSNSYRIIILKNKDKTKQHASLAKSDEVKKFEAAFALQCNKYRNAHINIPFEIEVDCFFRTKQSDLDNALKILLDCLQTVEAISNDNLCENIKIQKHVDPQDPRIEFTIHALEPLKPWVPKARKQKKKPERFAEKLKKITTAPIHNVEPLF